MAGEVRQIRGRVEEQFHHQQLEEVGAFDGLSPRFIIRELPRGADSGAAEEEGALFLSRTKGQRLFRDGLRGGPGERARGGNRVCGLGAGWRAEQRYNMLFDALVLNAVVCKFFLSENKLVHSYWKIE